MAQQQERGWPLGLRPMDSRAGVLLRRRRNHEFSGSASIGTFFISDSQTSGTDSSSDLDTESTGSFFPHRSVTLGRLMGIAGFVELSRRSNRGSTRQEAPGGVGGGSGSNDKTRKARAWLVSLCFFSSCSGTHVDDSGARKKTPCLADFLALERRGDDPAGTYELEGLLELVQDREDNYSLFSDGRVLPPESGVTGPPLTARGEANAGNFYGIEFRFPCASVEG